MKGRTGHGEQFDPYYADNLLKLILYLNFSINKIELNEQEFNNIFSVGKKLLLHDLFLNPF
ncbi:MAG: hypothetical protein KKH98_09575, partial [Spirochaetes bacterium]|nr:hypothetical protein [Spirochaetota bacterium]